MYIEKLEEFKRKTEINLSNNPQEIEECKKQYQEVLTTMAWFYLDHRKDYNKFYNKEQKAFDNLLSNGTPLSPKQWEFYYTEMPRLNEEHKKEIDTIWEKTIEDGMRRYKQIYREDPSAASEILEYHRVEKLI